MSSRPLLVVTRPVAEEALTLLRPRCTLRILEGDDLHPIPSEDELAKGLADAELCFTLPAHPVSRNVLAAAPKLRLISTMGTGYDNIDLAAARERGIPVTNAPGILDETTADLAFALLLAVARRLPESERLLRDGRFHGWTPFMCLGTDVHGSTLGIVGLGRIGQAVARRAQGFGMRILYAGRKRQPEAETRLGATHVPLEQLLADSDFVSLHVPLTPQTRHLLDATALARMKPSAFLINTSRGPVVDEAALAHALSVGRLAGAGLDVFENEPSVHPELLRAPNTVLLPHIGSASLQTRRRMAVRAAENVLAFLDGRALPNPVA